MASASVVGVQSRYRVGWLASVLLVAGPAVADELRGADEAAMLRTSQAAIGRVLGDHAFTDQDGRPLRIADLRGRPVVLNLIYTNCYYVCSGLTVHLRDVVGIAREALGRDGFSVLTVGFDAKHDTPARMRSYGVERAIDDARWHFASTDTATVRRLAEDVGFTWAMSPLGFDHVTQVTVIDGEGRVVEQVYGQDFAPPALIEPLKQLVWGRSAERRGAQGILDRVKLLCTVYDPASRRYRFDYSMFVTGLPGILALLMIAIAMLVYSRKPR